MTFHPTINLPVYLCIAVAGVGLVAALILRSSRVPGRQTRWLLLALRASVLAILLFILAGPVTRKSNENNKTREQDLFLLDTSESMSLGAPVSRFEQARAVVQSVLADQARRRNATVFRFDTALDLAPVDWRQLPEEATGSATNLGDSLVRLLQATGGEQVGNIIVCSDGRIHDRQALAEAVRMAKRHDVAVSALVLGQQGDVPNVAIRNCLVERHAPAGARLPMRVLLHAENAEGQPLRLVLKNGQGDILTDLHIVTRNGIMDKELELRLGNESETFKLELSKFSGELTHADNELDFTVDVVDPTIRVLYMEGSNHRDKQWEDRWEYELITEALRETGRIEVDVFTIDEQKAVGGRLYSVTDTDRGYPTVRDELFSYDVVICSDINRSIFTDEQLAWTVELVAELGGGFCMIGGYTAFGAGGWDKTVWEQMIPVDMQTEREGYVWEEFKPLIPEEARHHAIWQINTDAEDNERILESHPRFLGTNLVNRAKPAATVLALHERRDMPIICVQPYGKGRTMAFTSDAAGGWGEEYQTGWGEGEKDNRHYKRFWANAVAWLAENSVARHRARLVGNTEAVTYRAGETVRVRARKPKLADPGQLRGFQVTAGFEELDSEPTVLRLDPEAAEFVGELALPAEMDGTRATVVFEALDSAGQPAGKDRVTVRVMRIRKEFIDVTPDHDLMRKLATLTGGTLAGSEADVARLLEDAVRRREESRTYYTVPFWDTPWLWAAALLFLIADWLIRKYLGFAA